MSQKETSRSTPDVAEAEQVRALYAAYLQKATELETNRKPGQGLLGFGTTPADDPCHEALVVGLRELMDGFVSAGSSPDAVAECLEYIFLAPGKHRQPTSIYWTLIAAHSACPEAVGALDREGAERLYEIYAREYPRRSRLPVQERVIKALDRARRR